MPGGNKKVTHIGLRLLHYLYDSYIISTIPDMTAVFHAWP